MAGLVSALGAGPKGITGIASGGNKAGDLIGAHGTALYRREGDRWASVAPSGYRPSTAPAYATNAARGPAAILEAMREVIESVPSGASPAQREAIEQELLTAHAAIRGRLARLADGYAIAAGPEHGQYLRLAIALSDGKGVRTVPLVTRGGEENLRLLRAGNVALALSQGDAALEALEGRGGFFADGPYATLRAVGGLYPEPVHVLVRADSGLSSVADLKGRRVAIGVEGSASRATALRVLGAHALGPPGIVPLRLLALSGRAIANLAGTNAGYFAYTIARGTYATQTEDVASVATAALLLASTGLSETEVATITRFVFQEGRDLAVRGSAQGAQISAANARHGLSIPLHHAAAKALDAIAAK